MRRAASRRIDAEVLAALRRRNPHGAQAIHLDALARGHTAVVATGQQVGLFTGPLFTIYKAAGVVRMAQALATETGIDCVPLFWLQTEDHDFAEIDHCAVVEDGRRCRRIALEVGSTDRDARRPVGVRLLDESVDATLAKLADALEGLPAAEQTLALCRRHYRTGRTVAEAFADLLAELFAPHGLLLLDPRDAGRGGARRALLRRSLEQAEPLAAALAARSREIEAAGFHIQVPVRAGAPLCFLHPDGADGPRYRVEPSVAAQGQNAAQPAGQSAAQDSAQHADQSAAQPATKPTAQPVGAAAAWRLSGAGTRLTHDEALALVDTDPPAASTSALLRPLLQDSWLPTAVYLGGPGEIAYFAQLAPLYAALDVAMPLVAPRPSLVVTTEEVRERLNALGLEPVELAVGEDRIMERIVALPNAADLTRELLGDLPERLARFGTEAVTVDAKLDKAVQRTRANIDFAIEKLTGRYRKALAAREHDKLEAVRALEAVLAPGAVPQERVLGLPWAAAQCGPEEFVRRVLEAAEAGPAATRELAL